MGIEVSEGKVVTINDQHENGVDTSVEGNPSKGRFKGISLLHVFSRNHRGPDRADGNPLIYALKGRKGCSIPSCSKSQIMARAETILSNSAEALQGFDYVMPVPSSSPFCAEFAELVSAISGAPILAPDFLRKRQVGEVLAEIKANPPQVGRLKAEFNSQLHAWDKMNPDVLYQAKDVNVKLRLFFNAFALGGDSPDISGMRVLVADDIFSTGSSLASIREILQNQLGAEVSAAFFLSGV